jgi:hypothetical protein
MPELRTAQDFRETPTRTIAAAGAQFAYRELGPRACVPLVLLTHLGENLDRLAQDRHVITVDYSGAGDWTGNGSQLDGGDGRGHGGGHRTCAHRPRRQRPDGAAAERWPATCPPRP